MSAQPIRTALRRIFIEVEQLSNDNWVVSTYYEDVKDARAAVAAGRTIYEYGYIGKFKGEVSE